MWNSSGRRLGLMLRLSVRIATLVWSLAATLPLFSDDVAPASESDTHFLDVVQPILQQHCFECHSHGSRKAKGGLVLDSKSGWEKGGDSGPAIVPGNPDESLLIQAIRHGDLKMPPTGKLPAELIDRLERWVAEGAHDPRTTAVGTAPTTSIDLDQGRTHWAFQPRKKFSGDNENNPAVIDVSWPDSESPRREIDRFVLAALEAQGLRPMPDANKYSWLRRVCLDLTGLPPTVEQLQGFLNDNSPLAERRMVDQLLNSHAFAERWARHWLDLVGYADQIGTANDLFAEHAWRYRDYVIEAFHIDKPFDQFVREQIAGDLLPFDSPQQRATQLMATGFLVLGDLTVVEADKAKLRVDVVDQQVDKVGRAFLGMTIGCARCHDHKFDPISQRDYYALAGFFHSTESVNKAAWGIWSWPTMAELPETEPQRADRQARMERHQQQIAAIQAERERLRASKLIVDDALTKLTASIPSGSETSSDVPGRAALTKVQAELAEQLSKLDAQIGHIDFFAPAPPIAFAVHDMEAPNDMQVTIRGNAHALGEHVPRGFPRVLMEAVPAIDAKESGRKQLAEWLASPENPLTARVAVNRIWQKLFGEGLVRNVDYFGVPSASPTHPELLDFLAGTFIENGWSYKRLIRDLVLTRTYRLSSQSADPANLRLDPDNKLLWRMARTRLDSEAIRDSWLLVSGRLREFPGGPSLPLEYVENSGALARTGVNPPFFRLNRFRPEQSYERSVYLPVIRSAPQAGPAEIRNFFDFTQPAEFAGRRPTTTVPTQSLFLMNSKMIKDSAVGLAQRVLEKRRECGERLEYLWLRAYGRPIEELERTEATAWMTDMQEAIPRSEEPDGELRCWTDFCHAILASNEFLMRP